VRAAATRAPTLTLDHASSRREPHTGQWLRTHPAEPRAAAVVPRRAGGERARVRIRNRVVQFREAADGELEERDQRRELRGVSQYSLTREALGSQLAPVSRAPQLP
jgi:hypothetical protein